MIIVAFTQQHTFYFFVTLSATTLKNKMKKYRFNNNDDCMLSRINDYTYCQVITPVSLQIQCFIDTIEQIRTIFSHCSIDLYSQPHRTGYDNYLFYAAYKVAFCLLIIDNLAHLTPSYLAYSYGAYVSHILIILYYFYKVYIRILC